MGLLMNPVPVEAGSPLEMVLKLIDLARQEAKQEVLDPERVCLHLHRAELELIKLRRHFPVAAAFEIYS